MKDFIVICEDRSLFNLISLELTRLGYSVGTRADVRATVLILDADSKGCIDSAAYVKCKRTVGVSRNASTVFENSDFCTVLQRPVLLPELRSCAEALIAGIAKSADGNSARAKRSVIKPDARQRSVTVGEKIVPLSEIEYKIFAKLYENRGNAVSREELGAIPDGGGNELEVYVCRLRRKLEIGGKRLILTVRGVGYKLV